MARKEHPAANDWIKEAWTNWPHVVVRIPSALKGTVQERFEDYGLDRKVGLHLPTWAGIGPALRQTNMLANHVALLFEECPDAGDLQVFEPPLALPDLTFRIMWSARLDGDPAIVWLRTIVVQSINAVLDRAEEKLGDAKIIKARAV